MAILMFCLLKKLTTGNFPGRFLLETPSGVERLTFSVADYLS